MYDFNPLSPLDSERVDLDDKKNVDFVRASHEKVCANIEKQTVQYL